VTVEYRNENDAIAAAITSYRHHQKPVYVRKFKFNGTGLKGDIWVLQFTKPSSNFVTIDGSVEKFAHLYGR
jgi:hypothetical protein